MASADHELLTIQQLQFTDREAAQSRLKEWFKHSMNREVERVRLNPKAVSLNSFNGFYTINGQEYFFKTHVEEKGRDQEYYNAELLHRAGYNIVLPTETFHRYGRQMSIYPVIREPEMFDLTRATETGGDTKGVTPDQLLGAEKHECEQLLTIYDKTLQYSSAQEHVQAPVHQLFWHRLAGERLRAFYMDKSLLLPDQDEAGEDLPFTELLRYRWVINGKSISLKGTPVTLGELIERGKEVLQPEREMWTVIGHGDAHFGNVFLQDGKRYLYFDPAFAGRHSPLQDIVKPLYHNVFAVPWLYFGEEVALTLHLSVEIHNGTVYLEHDYRPSPLRLEILEVKREQLLHPLVTRLRERGALPEDWLDFLRSALLCCPLLTINTFERYPASICWLGLSQAMQIGTFEF
jgi:hypothetical protein